MARTSASLGVDQVELDIRLADNLRLASSC